MQLPKVTYCILRGCRIVMEYQNTMLCSGYSHELKPCEHIVNCDLCTGSSVDTYGNERYVCGRGVTDFRCKRDNPNWKPLTKQQLIELYKQMPDRTNISIGELLEGAIIDGIVEGNNDGISIQKNGTGDS